MAGVAGRLEDGINAGDAAQIVRTSLGKGGDGIVNDGGGVDAARKAGLSNQGSPLLDCSSACVVVLVSGVHAEGIVGIGRVKL